MENKNNPTNKNDSGFRELSDAEIEASSIFSKPNVEHKKPPKAKNIVLRTLIAVAVVALLIISVLVINKVFHKSAGASSTGSTATESKIDKTYYAVGMDVNDLTSIKLTNANGTLQFYSQEGSSDYDNDGDVDKDWYIKDIDKKYIDLDVTALTASDCANVEYLFERKLQEGMDYGFSEPEAVAEVEYKDGKYTITVGKRFSNSGMEGAYLKLSNKPNTIYVLATEYVDCYTTDLTYYIDTFAPTKVEQTDGTSKYFSDELDSFDYIELSGELVKLRKVRIEMYGRENSNLLYKMTLPAYTHVDGAKLSDMLDIMKENLETYELYYFNKDGIPADELKKYGLDNPQAVIEYKVGDSKTNIKLTQSQTDKNYYSMIVEGTPAIYKVTRLSFEFLSYSRMDYATNSVLLDNLDGLKSLTLSIDNKAYKFDISVDTTEEDGEEIEEIKVKYDGKTIKSSNFSNFYSYMLAISPYISESSLVQERPKDAQEYYNVKLKTVDKIKDPELNLTIFKLKDNDSRYYIELDGNPIGLCKKDFADMVVNNLEKLINNKDIESIL